MPQVGERNSHSLGPRLPNRSWKAATPAASSGAPGSRRDSSQSANDGAAESTSPMPAKIVMAASGLPTSAHTCAAMAMPKPDAAEIVMWRSKRGR